MKSETLSYLWSALMVVATVAQEKCHTSERPPDPGVECTVLVTARNYSGLDGCGMLLMREDGTKLLALNLESYAADTRDGDVLSISFEEASDVMSICMAEQKIVRLTCFRLISRGPDCADLLDPYRLSWSREVMNSVDPRKVEEIRTTDGVKWYRFSGEEVRIYDCHGNLVCQYYPGDSGACQEVLDKIMDTVIIYIVND